MRLQQVFKLLRLMHDKLTPLTASESAWQSASEFAFSHSQRTRHTDLSQKQPLNQRLVFRQLGSMTILELPRRNSQEMSIGTTSTSVELSSTAPSSPPSTRRDSISTSNTTGAEEPALTEEEIEKKPWKYIGYKGYSKFIASDNDFYVVRKFATLNTRVTLALQDEIVVLESDLDVLDAQYSKRDAENLHNGSFRDDRQDRNALIEKITSKLAKYSEQFPSPQVFSKF